MKTELREELEGEGDGAREREVWRLLAFGTGTVSLRDEGSDIDLVLSVYPAALLRPGCLCFCMSSASF